MNIMCDTTKEFATDGFDALQICRNLLYESIVFSLQLNESQSVGHLYIDTACNWVTQQGE